MSERVHSVLALYETPAALMDAIGRIRPRRFGRLEAYTPYPIHGIEDALGLKRSPLPGMVFVMGLVGVATSFAFQYWMNGVDYPLVTGGKAPGSWQAFVPIMFEVMVLFATFTAGLGMVLLLNRLPSYEHPVLAMSAGARITRDRFALAVEAEGAALDVEAIREALAQTGAVSIETVAEPDPPAPMVGLKGLLWLGGAGLVACAVGVIATIAVVKLFPVLPPMVHMLDQPRLDAQSPGRFFADQSGVRPAPRGAVARGRMGLAFAGDVESGVLGNPLPRSDAVLAAGRKGYGERCVVCHGALGDGRSLLTQAYGAKPANLHAGRLREAGDGQIYHVIAAGKNSMPGYAREIDEDRRWSIVHYVRALQRSQNAEARDLK